MLGGRAELNQDSSRTVLYILLSLYIYSLHAYANTAMVVHSVVCHKCVLDNGTAQDIYMYKTSNHYSRFMKKKKLVRNCLQSLAQLEQNANQRGNTQYMRS